MVLVDNFLLSLRINVWRMFLWEFFYLIVPFFNLHNIIAQPMDYQEKSGLPSLSRPER